MRENWGKRIFLKMRNAAARKKINALEERKTIIAERIL